MRLIEVIANTPHPGIRGARWHSGSMIAALPLPLLLDHDAGRRIGTVRGIRVVSDRVMAWASVRDEFAWRRVCAGGCLSVSSCTALAEGHVRDGMLYEAELREVSLLCDREPDNPECRVVRAWTVAETPKVELTW